MRKRMLIGSWFNSCSSCGYSWEGSRLSSVPGSVSTLWCLWQWCFWHPLDRKEMAVGMFLNGRETPWVSKEPLVQSQIPTTNSPNVPLIGSLLIWRQKPGQAGDIFLLRRMARLGYIGFHFRVWWDKDQGSAKPVGTTEASSSSEEWGARDTICGSPLDSTSLTPILTTMSREAA